jgi:FMN phosphatase YigB (HAD superfamily)
MSLVPKLGKNYEALPGILEQFVEDLKPATEQLKKEGKLLETSLSKNSSYMHYYDERRIQLHTLVKYFRSEVDRVRSDCYRKYNEVYTRELTYNLMTKYIDGEEDYLFVYRILIEVEELYEEYVGVVEAFKQRNFELGHMTKLRIANLEFSEI